MNLLISLWTKFITRPCGVCGHYHDTEEAEACGICGHRSRSREDSWSLKKDPVHGVVTEILPDFLYLSDHHYADNLPIVIRHGITHALNTVPDCNSVLMRRLKCHWLQEKSFLPFEEAIQFLKTCNTDKGRVLVHCMAGINRSPAIVIAFLMKFKGWTLSQSHQWVKERRPIVNISSDFYQQLQDFERKIRGSVQSDLPVKP